MNIIRRGKHVWLLSMLFCSQTSVAQNFGQVAPNQAIDFTRIGQNQTEALKVNEAIYQGIGFGNTFLITTPDGNVIVDTSSPNVAQRHRELLTKVSAAPVRYIILTHGHGDHTGGVHLWKQEGTQIITQRIFPEFRAYQDRLAMFFARNNAAQFNFDEARLKSLSQSPQNTVTPTIVFDDRYDFELGGTRFEVFHTPGETPDALSVWVPKYKAAFVGDNVYDSFPNIYTLRGTSPRWALDYVASINKVLKLQPEFVLPSHGLPIVGHDPIVKRLTKYRDAIQYVHDATVKGMNDGKDVFTLMREVKLPAELDMGETYGKVAWSVRGIYEGYVGWFDRNPATMYSASPNVADADLVELAGGAGVVAAKSRAVTQAGDAIRGLRLADAALAREPTHRGALEAKLAALQALQKSTRNGLEHAWLGYGMRGVQKLLDGAGTGD
ncbi:MAG: MBL fold metallo-hydrolase [Planctomycetia bacterium]|nr:MBL fold metallo-hydrolase [Planctomycetia bacterium]